MYHPKLAGSYSEMGFQHGSSVYQNGFRMPEQSRQRIDFGKECEIHIRDFFPEILEEIKGFSEGCHASYEQTAAFIMGIGVFYDSSNCSVFAARSSSDVIFGRNFDFMTIYKKTAESLFTIPEHGYRNIGHSDCLIGLEDGINEKGLAVGGSYVFSDTVKPGVSFNIAARYVMDKCASVVEAIEALTKIQYALSSNFLFADKSGDMAVLEFSAEKGRIRRPVEGETFIICTNHFILPEMVEMENLKRRDTEALNTLARYDVIYNALKQSGDDVNIEKAQEILRDHKGHVCCHRPDLQIGTLWSITASLAESRIMRAEGNPCRAKYKLDSRLNI